MKEGLRFVDKNMNLKSMPNPFQVSLLRTEMNGNLKNYIGDYYHINNSWQIPVKAGEDPKKRNTPTHLHLNENNTLFVDVETVQRSIVKLYDITLEELDNGPLVFVLKMDKAEIVKQEKQEQISITLMNRHMKNPGLSKKDPKYFSVQSEHNI
ncbi:hypothetical protein M758_UG183700 [Ceratodon purpureus]|nr:hypothetical protein M758_UG183700 [Ceratodon purpureus]